MKRVTINRQVFTLDELEDTARQTALDGMRQYLYEWMEPCQISEFLNGELMSLLTGEFTGEIDDKDLKTRTGLNIEWSLSHCQGDGVAIYGTLYADDAPNLEWYGATSANLKRIGNYSHENSFTVSLHGQDDEGYDVDYDDKDTEIFADQLRDLCRELARRGYNEINNLTSETAALEHLEMYEPRRFDETGNILPTMWWTER